MQKLIAVEEARALMTEAREWSVWRWLTEKKRVRAAADRATAALNELDEKVKASWSEELTKAYRHPRAKDVSPAIRQLAAEIKEADEAAEQARLDAESTFDEAERRMSASMAREGTQKAIDSWDLRQKAIRKAEAARRA